MALERFTFTDEDLKKGAEALIAEQRPGTTWDDLDEADRGNTEHDVEAVLEALGGSWMPQKTEQT